MCRCAYIPYFKINAPIFCCFIFSEECFNPQVKIYKMLNEHTVDYHSSPSEFTSKIHQFIFLWNPNGFISPEYLLIFIGVKITGKYICELKNWICSILIVPPSKTLHQIFIITTPDRRKLPISPPKKFLKVYFSPAQRERTMELKIWPKLNFQGYWSQFWYIPPFPTFIFLVSVLLCHNLDSSMVKCEGCLT